MLMHRQAPIALSALVACAAAASASLLLRQQILHFSSGQHADGGALSPQLAIPQVRELRPGPAPLTHSRQARLTVTRTGAASAVPALGAGGALRLAAPFALPAASGMAPGASTVPGVAGPSPDHVTATLTGPGSGQAPAPASAPAIAPAASPSSAASPGATPAGTTIAAGSGTTTAGTALGAIRVAAAAQPAELAPEADLAPVDSSADNAPPPPDAAAPPAADPQPPPAPVDPAPADQTPADPAPADPAPPTEPPAAEVPAPTPEVPSAPADPAPPSDGPEPPADPPPAILATAVVPDTA